MNYSACVEEVLKRKKDEHVFVNQMVNGFLLAQNTFL